jgi:hypothetical protein
VYLKFRSNSKSDPTLIQSKSYSKAPTIQIKWDDRICKDEQLLPLELLQIRNGMWTKNSGRQGLFQDLGN